jgi:hypothetical protein
MTSATWALAEKLFRKERRTIDKSASVVLAELARENALLADTPLLLVQRLLIIYRGLRPAFSLLLKLPMVPANVRKLLETLMHVLDDLDSPEVIGRFKAGRDL